jgi:hypothetical protein
VPAPIASAPGLRAYDPLAAPAGAPGAPAPSFDHAPYDVIERLEQARAAVRDNDPRLATGLYTWVWERAETLDPAARAYRRTLLPDEILHLASQNKPTRERFGDIRDQLSRRLLYVGFGDLMVWFTLNEICGDPQENINYLDLYTNDRDEAAMMPRAHYAAYRLIAAREKFIDPWRVDEPARRGSKSAMPADPDGAALAHVRAVARRLNEPRKASITPEDFDTLQAFRRGYLIDESARLHTALLRAGRDPLAREAIDVALKALPDGADRAQLLNSTVFCALALGMARPEVHAGYLAQADALGFGNLTLELRLREATPAPQPATGTRARP